MGVNPEMHVRVPAETQHKMRRRAAELNMRPGQYVAQLIEEDWKESNRIESAQLVVVPNHNDQDNA